MSSENEKLVIGSEEWCSFPDLGIPAILARVDSGAKTSSIHAFNIQRFKKGGKPWISFEVHPLKNNRKITTRCEMPVHDKRSIKSSTGIAETRYVIKTSLKMGEHTFEVELTLSNRDSMGFRMLLGREAMKGKMIIDPSKEQCLGDISEQQLNSFYGPKDQEQNGLNIGLIASDQELYSNRRILEAGEDRGHQMHFYNIKQCYMRLDADNPEVHYRGGNSIANLDAVITRIRPSITFYGCALARQFESMGIKTLNTADSITKSRDKLYSLQMMLKNGIDIPTTGFANSPMDTNDLIEMVGGAPLIVKLLEGSQGKGVVLAETKKAAESVINAFKSLKANLLVQEFIKEADGKDLRLFVIDGKVVASIQREAAPGEFRANLHQGGSANVIKPSSEEKALAIKASKIFGLFIAGVDIIRSKNGPLLLEINSSPGLEGIEEATGKDIASMIITAIEKKLKWKKPLSEKI